MNSKHKTGQAVDIYDPKDDIDTYLSQHPELLEELGLWAEHPSKTHTWSHLQNVAPKSGNRFFYP
jgi:hypothetical protein